MWSVGCLNLVCQPICVETDRFLRMFFRFQELRHQMQHHPNNILVYQESMPVNASDDMIFCLKKH